MARYWRWLGGRLVLVTAGMLVLVSMGATLEDCGGTGPQQGDGPACGVHRRHSPQYFSQPRPHGSVKGSINVECAVRQPATFHLEMWLERDVTGTGNWLIQAGIYHDCAIPPKTAPGQQHDIVFEGCISGRWRMMVRVSGAGNGVKPFTNWKWPEVPTNDIKCPGP